MKRIFIVIVSSVMLICQATGTGAQVLQKEPAERRGVDIIEKTGGRIPLDVVFYNDSGEEVQLGNYFHRGKPVILALAYYDCPMLCTLVLNGISDAVRPMNLLPGSDFDILTVSIDPRETVELAAAKKSRYVTSLGKAGVDDGWIFFVGDEADSKELADSLGFTYYYDEKKDEYAHAAAIFVLTEDGTISRYFYGIEYSQRDLRFALMEASKGQIGTTLDRIILLCYHYDPEANGYVPFAANIMRIGGILTVVFLGIIVGTLVRRERLRKGDSSAS